MQTSSVYFVSHLSERVNLKPDQLDNNIPIHITRNAKKKLEGKCTRFGFIRPDSLVIVTRSVAYHKGCHFHGEMTVDIEAVADVCKPARGDRITCQVDNINRMGLRARAGDCHELQVYVVTQHHNNAVFFKDSNSLKINAVILIEVIGAKSKLNDDKIVVIGKLLKVYDSDDLLEDYDNKTVQIPSSADLVQCCTLDLEVTDKPPESKGYFGYLPHVLVMRQSLGKQQQEVKEIFAKMTDDKRQTSAEAISKRASKAFSYARSLTNDFELVSPNYSYDPHPKVVSPYKPISRAFFKLWEILSDFRILPERAEQEVVVTAHVAESPGSFVEAAVQWRKKGSSVDKNLDKHLVMSISKSTDEAPGVPEASKLEQLQSRTDGAVQLVSGGISEKGAIPKGYRKRQGDGTGDIFKLGNIRDFAADVLACGGADLVTGDLGFEFDGLEDVREQCMHFPIFCEIVAVAACQKTGGSCVIKIFDLFTKVSVKLLVFMTTLYDEVHVTKPYTSRSGNPEKYVVGKRFKGISHSQLQQLFKTFTAWSGIESCVGGRYLTNAKFVHDLTNVKLNQQILDSVAAYNTANVLQRQMRTITRTIDLLKKCSSKTLKQSDTCGLDIDHDAKQAIKRKQEELATVWLQKYMDIPDAATSSD